MTPFQEQVLLGTLLGDGWVGYALNKGRALTPARSPRLVIRHSVKQEAYLHWKASVLAPVLGGEVRIEDNRGYGDRSAVYASRSRPELRAWRDLFYHPKKRLSEAILGRLGAPGLAVWFMDDGSCTPSMLSLSTHGFSTADVSRAADWFSVCCGWRCGVQATPRGAFLYFTGAPKDDFLTVVSEHVHLTLAYKVKPRPSRGPARGSRHGCAILTEDDVLAIRSRRAGKETYASIAADYGVTLGTIFDACNRSWRHV